MLASSTRAGHATRIGRAPLQAKLPCTVRSQFRHVSWGLGIDEGVSTPRTGSRPRGRGLAPKEGVSLPRKGSRSRGRDLTPEEGVSAFDYVRVEFGSQRGEGGIRDSNLREFISLSASSRTKAFRCYSAFAASIFAFTLCIHRARSGCLWQAVITKATGTPFCHSSNTIIVNSGNCSQPVNAVSNQETDPLITSETHDACRDTMQRTFLSLVAKVASMVIALSCLY
jgi:hypothetical protein